MLIAEVKKRSLSQRIIQPRLLQSFLHGIIVHTWGERCLLAAIRQINVHDGQKLGTNDVLNGFHHQLEVTG